MNFIISQENNRKARSKTQALIFLQVMKELE